MSVYVSYSDESSSNDKLKNFFFAGYGADDKQWPEFSERWSQEIIESPPKIPHLHMTAIRSNAWREANGITRLQADIKVRKAVELLMQSDYLSPFIGSIPEHLYTQAKVKLEKVGLSFKRQHQYVDYPCFIAYLVAIVRYVGMHKPDTKKIIFNISRKNHVSHYLVHELRENLIENLKSINPSLVSLIGDFVPLSMEEHMPLQAADVLCWHVQRANNDNEEPEVINNIQLLQEREFVEAVEITEAQIDAITDGLIQQAKLDHRSEEQT